MQNGTSDSALREMLCGVEAIALDWNGTTVSDIDRAMRATNLVLSRRNMPTLSLAEFRSTFTLPMRIYFAGLGLPSEEIVAATDEWNSTNATEAAALSSGVEMFLEAAAARNLPVGIISAASPDVVLADAKRLGIAGALAFVRGDATFKSLVLRELRDSYGGRVLYCGDTEYDITEAVKAHAVAVAFGGGYRPLAALAAAGAEYSIDDFATLAEGICRSKE